MRFRWDWLRPVVTVPYVPTIGPVHPSVLTEDLFTDTLIAAPTDRFLRYDKDLRWSDTKDERVLVEDVVHRLGETLIPTLLRRGSGTVKVHVYGAAPDSRVSAEELALKLCAVHNAAKARVVWFAGPEHPASQVRGTRIQLKDFAATPSPLADGPVQDFDSFSIGVRRTFGDFAQRMTADGFVFLHSCMLESTVGPVLVAVADGRVAGAIGPMEIRPDAVGTAQLLPQYFGVLPEHRGRGLGRFLWRAAMNWGQTHGAAYQLLQTEVGGSSDRLCQSEGLCSLGFICSSPVR
jgi:GNAT superfamily N-acetyltransferase